MKYLIEHWSYVKGDARILEIHTVTLTPEEIATLMDIQIVREKALGFEPSVGMWL